MGMYGSGISFKQACAYDRERIKAALDGFELDIDTGEKYPISKEEATEIILGAYDEAVYQATKSMTGGRVLEKMLVNKTGGDRVKIANEYVEEFMKEEQEEALKEASDDEEDEIPDEDK